MLYQNKCTAEVASSLSPCYLHRCTAVCWNDAGFVWGESAWKSGVRLARADEMRKSMTLNRLLLHLLITEQRRTDR